MSLRIPRLSLKCEPLVSASAAGVAGLRRSGQELSQTESDCFTSPRIFYRHARQTPPALLAFKLALASRQLTKTRARPCDHQQLFILFHPILWLS